MIPFKINTLDSQRSGRPGLPKLPPTPHPTAAGGASGTLQGIFAWPPLPPTTAQAPRGCKTNRSMRLLVVSRLLLLWAGTFWSFGEPLEGSAGAVHPGGPTGPLQRPWWSQSLPCSGTEGGPDTGVEGANRIQDRAPRPHCRDPRVRSPGGGQRPFSLRSREQPQTLRGRPGKGRKRGWDMLPAQPLRPWPPGSLHRRSFSR